MKTKKQKKFYIALLVVFVMAMYGFIPPVFNAKAVDAITAASDTLSDSDLSEPNVIHTFDFTTGTTTMEDGFWRITFPAGFTNVGSGSETCGYGQLTASTTGQMVDCVAGVGGQTATSTKVVITGLTNPGTDSASGYVINLEHYDMPTHLQERVQIVVYIIDHILMTARVNATLAFTVTGTSTGQIVNGATCDQDTTATTTDFGVLSFTASTTVCQDLTVTTNASDGYIVTVEQDGELTSNALDNINSFNNAPTGTGSSTLPIAWAPPLGTLDVYNTYGHMGLTSNDSDLLAKGYMDFTGEKYVGFNGTDPVIVMSHDHPSDGKTPDKGKSSVAYTVEISTLQEAGDYESILTYIATATF